MAKSRACRRPGAVAPRPPASSLTLLTVAGLNVGTLIGGAIIVEVIFSMPGVGTSCSTRPSRPVSTSLQSLVAIIAVGYVLVNFLVDVLYAVLDPRIRHARSIETDIVHDGRPGSAPTPRPTPSTPSRRWNRPTWPRRSAWRPRVGRPAGAAGRVRLARHRLAGVRDAGRIAGARPAARRPQRQRGVDRRKPPGTEGHPGRRRAGRDMLSRMVWGARASCCSAWRRCCSVS